MELCDKDFVLSLLSMPRLGLSAEQVRKIEAVIDGGALPDEPRVLSYDDAAARLGLTAKNRTKTICLWVRKGYLAAVTPPNGKKAIGVSAESVAAFAAQKKKV
jgi:prolyl-tRNA editing enzyme YbaK/EbsC (Cys-tRNA(Pro) deacylase)